MVLLEATIQGRQIVNEEDKPLKCWKLSYLKKKKSNKVFLSSAWMSVPVRFLC